MRRKSAELAAILSFIIPGLGQIYGGNIARGFIFILATMIAASLCPVLIGFFIALPLWIWAVADAYSSVEKMNGAYIRRRYEKNR